MAYRLTNNEGHSSPSGTGLVRRGLSRLAAVAAALGRTLAEYPARRRAYDELRAMTDRELADIGLTRYDVNRGFDPDFLGVIGPIDDVVQAAQAYGIPVEPPEQTDGNYLVTHGERVAVLRPGGDAVGFFDPGTSGEQMSAVLPGLLAEQL